MSSDEIKQDTKTGTGVQGLVDLARRSVPDVRRNAETIEPISPRRGGALLQRARQTLDWRRLPVLRPREEARRPERLLRRLFKRFALFVLGPTAVIGLYLILIATPQYVVESKFAVRGNVEPMEDSQLGQYTDLIQKHNSQDSFIVRDYILSRPMVEELEKSLGLSKMFSGDAIDLWARFDNSLPIERLVRYWRQHVTVRVDAVSGVLLLSVRAFSAEDALAISKGVIARAEALVNEISRRAQADMVTQSRKEVEQAVERLKKARLAMQEFRNRWGFINPVDSAKSTLTTIETLRAEKLKAENDLRVLRDSKLDERTRGIQVLVATVGAIDGQMKQLQNRLTTEGLATDASHNLTQALLEFEERTIDVTVATKLHESMQFLLDKARIAASKQQIYLATFVPPLLPTYSAYPAKFYTLFVAMFCFLVLWSSISLVSAAVNDQRL